MSNRKIKEDIAKLRQGDNPTKFSTITKTLNTLYGTDYKEPSVRRMYYEWQDEQENRVESIKRKEYLDNVRVSIDSPRVLIIPDVHLPFVASGFIEFLAQTRDKYKLDTVFCIGDILDYCAISFWEKDPDGLSASSEFYKTIPQLTKLSNLFPRMRITMGNHDARPHRVAKKSGLPAWMIRHPNEIITNLTGGDADVSGWEWNNSYILNGNTLIEHGEHSGLGATYDKAVLTSFNVIQGHTHSYGGIMYINDGYTERYALNVGCGIDNKAYAFYYAKSHKMKPTLGCGVILDGVPQFIPFNSL